MASVFHERPRREWAIDAQSEAVNLPVAPGSEAHLVVKIFILDSSTLCINFCNSVISFRADRLATVDDIVTIKSACLLSNWLFFLARAFILSLSSRVVCAIWLHSSIASRWTFVAVLGGEMDISHLCYDDFQWRSKQPILQNASKTHS